MPRNTQVRDRRLAEICSLIEREAVRSQDELILRLRAAGHDVVQSSISRDLKDLGVVKVDGRYRVREALIHAAEPEAPLFGPSAHLLRQVATAGPHLVVLHTAVGAASQIGLAIDSSRWSEVVGTVAGDDTLFVAVNSKEDQTTLVRRIERLVKKEQNLV